MTPSYETIKTRLDGTVLSATFSAPPMNLIGPELVRDLVAMIEEVSRPAAPKVVIFDSADPDFFFPHVDMTKVPEYTAEAAKAGGPGDASLGMLFRKLSRLPAVTIAKLRGRARERAASSSSPATCASPRGRTPSWASPKWGSEHLPARARSSTSPG
ncbi:hypothetical protein ABT040_44420 [Streptomyces sp. NPDC002688]|uniref:hypothetical protein n=1 Tax=Streptomyces sp. NPDC002688 TaxID=3154423 RepID=UPI0033348660